MAESTRSGQSCWPDCTNLYVGAFHWFLQKLFNLNVQHSCACHFKPRHKSSPCPPMILPSGEKAFAFFTCRIKISPRDDGFSMKTAPVRVMLVDVIPDLNSHLRPRCSPAADRPRSIAPSPADGVDPRARGRCRIAGPLSGSPVGTGQSILQAARSGNGNHSPSCPLFTWHAALECPHFLHTIIPSSFSA